MYYFSIYPELWAFYLTVFIPQLTLTLLIYLVMFILFYPWMSFYNSIFQGPLGFFSAWYSVLNVSTTVSIFIVTYLLLAEVQRVAFDAVMSREFSDDVVLLGKLRRIAKVPFIVKCGRIFWIIPYLFVLPYLIGKVIVILSIQHIPIPFVNIILSILLQAPSKGLQAHSRYFALKGFDKRQIHAIYKSNRGAYLGFGIVAVVLEHIPFIGLLFMFTDTLGAALWAVTIEQAGKRQASIFRDSTDNSPKDTKLGHDQEQEFNSSTVVH
ncbi:uncharacterized protein RJT21DRAFT_24396 [Scheffersomyces amazonensis]|uniref:uncharacterized protein n=1 Tax=Scheffersomyces amazonensis TaxID=1078765 RepID=UPI00315D9ED8